MYVARRKSAYQSDCSIIFRVSFDSFDSFDGKVDIDNNDGYVLGWRDSTFDVSVFLLSLALTGLRFSLQHSYRFNSNESLTLT